MVPVILIVRTMKAKDLKQLLSQLPEDTEIYLQSYDSARPIKHLQLIKANKERKGIRWFTKKATTCCAVLTYQDLTGFKDVDVEVINTLTL